MIWTLFFLPSSAHLFGLQMVLGKSVRSETALLLIDLQTAFWDAGTFTETAKGVAKERVLAEVKTAKASGVPVIGVRHE